MKPQQGDIYWVNLNPAQGSEQSGERPVVVVSGNSMNNNFPVSIACPLTTRVKNYVGCVVIKSNKTNNLTKDSEIITFQIRTISHQRFGKKIGKISDQELAEIKQGLNDVLTF